MVELETPPYTATGTALAVADGGVMPAPRAIIRSLTAYEVHGTATHYVHAYEWAAETFVRGIAFGLIMNGVMGDNENVYFSVNGTFRFWVATLPTWAAVIPIIGRLDGTPSDLDAPLVLTDYSCLPCSSESQAVEVSSPRWNLSCSVNTDILAGNINEERSLHATYPIFVGFLCLLDKTSTAVYTYQMGTISCHKWVKDINHIDPAK
jgi:hypothetical protein